MKIKVHSTGIDKKCYSDVTVEFITEGKHVKIKKKLSWNGKVIVCDSKYKTLNETKVKTNVFTIFDAYKILNLDECMVGLSGQLTISVKEARKMWNELTSHGFEEEINES
jgi:hypothetical protein